MDSDDSGDEYQDQVPSRSASEAASNISGLAVEDLDLIQPAMPDSLPKRGPKETPKQQGTAYNMGLPIRDGRANYCGLCHDHHETASCPMTQKPENLVEYRRIIIEDEEEPYDERVRSLLKLRE